jgi:hypothetical protein
MSLLCYRQPFFFNNPKTHLSSSLPLMKQCLSEQQQKYQRKGIRQNQNEQQQQQPSHANMTTTVVAKPAVAKPVTIVPAHRVHCHDNQFVKKPQSLSIGHTSALSPFEIYEKSNALTTAELKYYLSNVIEPMVQKCYITTKAYVQMLHAINVENSKYVSFQPSLVAYIGCIVKGAHENHFVHTMKWVLVEMIQKYWSNNINVPIMYVLNHAFCLYQRFIKHMHTSSYSVYIALSNLYNMRYVPFHGNTQDRGRTVTTDVFVLSIVLALQYLDDHDSGECYKLWKDYVTLTMGTPAVPSQALKFAILMYSTFLRYIDYDVGKTSDTEPAKDFVRNYENYFVTLSSLCQTVYDTSMLDSYGQSRIQINNDAFTAGLGFDYFMQKCIQTIPIELLATNKTGGLYSSYVCTKLLLAFMTTGSTISCCLPLLISQNACFDDNISTQTDTRRNIHNDLKKAINMCMREELRKSCT